MMPEPSGGDVSREVELKSVVDDLDLRRHRLEAAGARLVFEGRLEDRRYDRRLRPLARRDHVLRLRIYRDDAGVRGALDWKGPTGYEDGYKVREELTTSIGDPDATATMLRKVGFFVTREIAREIAQFEIAGAMVRFERYPRMDTLVEVEGPPDAIELAISALGMAREGFTAERLPDFVRRFEERTGQRAAICDRELRGDYRFATADA